MKHRLIAILLIISINSYSQINHIEILIGKTDQEVTHYLDSLNSLKSNIYYKIKKDVSVDGELTLQSSFSLNDESYYTCTSVTLFFRRVQEVEICIAQIILGSTKFAQSNLNFIKDNFETVSNNNWRMVYNSKLQITAIFERKNGDYPSYKIEYDLEKIHDP